MILITLTNLTVPFERYRLPAASAGKTRRAIVVTGKTSGRHVRQNVYLLRPRRRRNRCGSAYKTCAFGSPDVFLSTMICAIRVNPYARAISNRPQTPVGRERSGARARWFTTYARRVVAALTCLLRRGTAYCFSTRRTRSAAYTACRSAVDSGENDVHAFDVRDDSEGVPIRSCSFLCSRPQAARFFFTEDTRPDRVSLPSPGRSSRTENAWRDGRQRRYGSVLDGTSIPQRHASRGYHRTRQETKRISLRTPFVGFEWFASTGFRV